MRQRGSRKAWGAGALLLVGLAGRGLAAGPSPLEGYPVAYQGQVFQSNVAAANQSLQLALTLYDGQSPQAGTLCFTQGLVQTDASGHFQLLLDPTCGPALARTPQAWVELQLTGQPAQPRTQLGAVPYAAQASHAATADAVTFGDDLVVNATLGFQLNGMLPAVLSGGGASYTTEAVYVGPLPHDSQGAFGSAPYMPHGGYALVDQQCAASYGVGAHFCTPQEMLRSETLGLAEDVGGDPAALHSSAGWVAGAMSSDCKGYTSFDGADVGPSWDFATGTGIQSTCDGHLSVLCCK
jgi:hypothetical protein